ncbi:BFD domain protein (2Fe-2S)-binding domain protein [Thiorhodococcus drewsii AZ1]|uniref:Bacterioferritin-associated ferredoxin n=2 Tax=Thiorhodococcus drewsii TaxID=210408 RepID=G2DY34_9GAMM|nr:BFD domain protein (2Fe-2S)-binding domain protein [Thiorhodococcus drewsii AZ1]
MRIVRIFLFNLLLTFQVALNMYVCICNSVTDRQIREAVEKGHDTLGKLRSELGVSTCCGKCKECARNLLNEVVAEPDCFNLVLSAAA